MTLPVIVYRTIDQGKFPTIDEGRGTTVRCWSAYLSQGGMHPTVFIRHSFTLEVKEV